VFDAYEVETYGSVELLLSGVQYTQNRPHYAGVSRYIEPVLEHSISGSGTGNIVFQNRLYISTGVNWNFGFKRLFSLVASDKRASCVVWEKK